MHIMLFAGLGSVCLVKNSDKVTTRTSQPVSNIYSAVCIATLRKLVILLHSAYP